MKRWLIVIIICVATSVVARGEFMNPDSGLPVHVLPSQLIFQDRLVVNPSWNDFYTAGWRKIVAVSLPGTVTEAARTIKTVTGYTAVTNSAGEELYQEIATTSVQSIFYRQDQSLDLVWPILTAHPSINDIPAEGLTYRLNDGTNITWWILRQSDVIATQLSAHDGQGNPIIRTRYLATGVETTIDINDINNRTASVSELATVKDVLRELHGLISTNKSEVQAILTTDTTAAAQQDQIRSLRRELIDVTDNLQSLRKQLLKSMREVEVE